MAGYEELTPDQLIYIVQLIVIGTISCSVIMLIRSIISLKISKNVKHLELMIENKISDGIAKPSLFVSLKAWWDRRKEKKVDPMDKYLPKADTNLRR